MGNNGLDTTYKQAIAVIEGSTEFTKTQRVGGSDFLLGPGRLLEWPGFAGEVKGLV
ncbi:feruloyl esterase [Aspergillus luchuensis]|uniref:Feruloyl esterase n=1 Tax=Aspergillus kawachii TaxID=1069201 RepID=A0A146FQB7_ASPKA|nr:feruloyl esterase [Aspergillus luchuensis]